ncbi:MAG TPA: RsmG family class I SAM-dependent methyltransferase [Candidatus Dormibacteraeota bacterium]
MDSKLAEYARLLAGWPGLVGRGEDAGALVEDALVLLPHLGDAVSLVDVGSGGGMPGIPLALARPQLRVTLLEADARKAAFLTHAAARLGLDLRVVNERAEVAARSPLREAFDAACCRALAALPVALELCLPLVRVGGRLLALTTEEGVAGAEQLGGGPAQVVAAPSRLRAQGRVVIVPKVAPTPEAFPRRPGVPARRPLGT